MTSESPALCAILEARPGHGQAWDQGNDDHNSGLDDLCVSLQHSGSTVESQVPGEESQKLASARLPGNTLELPRAGWADSMTSPLDAPVSHS